MNIHAKNIFWVYFFTMLGIPIGYLCRLLYAGNLSLEDYGLYYGFFGFFAFFGFLRSWGVEGASVYFTNKYLARGENHKVKTLFFFNQSVQVLMSILMSALFFYFNDWIFQTFYPGETHIRPMFNLFLLFWISQTVFETTELFFRIFQNQYLSALLAFLRQLLLYVFSWIFFQNIVSYLAPLWAQLVISILFACIALFLLLRKHSQILLKSKFYFKKDLFVEVGKYANIVAVAGFASIIFNAVDTMMIQYFLGSKQVAFFSTATSTAGLLTLFITPLAMVMYPLIVKLWHHGEKAQVGKIISLLLNNFLIFFLPLALACILFAEDFIVAMYGAQFLPSVILIQILAFAIGIQSLNQILASVVPAFGRPEESVKIVIKAGIFNAGGNLVLIHSLGNTGVVIATVVSFLINGFLLLRLVREEVQISFDVKNNLKIIFASLLFIIFAYFLKQIMYYQYTAIVSLNFLLNGSIIFLISAVVYAWILMFFGVITKEKIQTLRELVLAKK